MKPRLIQETLACFVARGMDSVTGLPFLSLRTLRLGELSATKTQTTVDLNLSGASWMILRPGQITDVYTILDFTGDPRRGLGIYGEAARTTEHW